MAFHPEKNVSLSNIKKEVLQKRVSQHLPRGNDLIPDNDLASQPTLRIELLRFVTQLEVQGAVARCIASHTTQRLSSSNVLTLPHGNSREITIDRDVATMAHNHVGHASHGEDGSDLTIKYTACLSTSRSSEVDTLIVKRHPIETIHVVSPEVARNRVVASDGHG